MDARNIQRSLENAATHFEMGAAFGLDPHAGIEANWAQMRRIWSGKPEDAERRRTALRAIRRATMESNELNVEYGYRYDSAAASLRTARPSRSRSTPSVCTSRARVRAARCRTRGSTTKTDSVGR